MEITGSKRVLLRDLTEADWQAVHSYASDLRVVQYMDWGPNTEEDTTSFIRQAIAGQKERPRQNFKLAIVLKIENRLVGGCGIHVSNPENREGWIGYCLDGDFWGKGYATEVASMLVDFGFSKLRLHRIFATCDPANTASAHVLEKVGMKREGHLREHKYSKGKWRDSYVYAILEQDWKGPKPSSKDSKPKRE